MHRLHRIFLIDYEDFNLERNVNLDRLYLYKCLTYNLFFIKESFFIFNKIKVLFEINIYNDFNNINIFNSFIEFLKENNNKFYLTKSDIDLINYVFKFCYHKVIKINENMDSLKNNIKIETSNKAFYKAQLKF